jgi:hypothetical protein
MLVEIKTYEGKLLFKIDEDNEIIKIYPDQNQTIGDAMYGTHLTEILLTCELLQVNWSIRVDDPNLHAPFIQISF